MALYSLMAPSILCVLILLFGQICFAAGDNRKVHTQFVTHRHNVSRMYYSLRSTSNCVSGYCVPDNYNTLEPPGSPTHVRIKFRVNDVTSVDDVNFSITMYTYIVFTWHDQYLYRDDRIGEANRATGWDDVNAEFSKYVVG